MVSKAACDGAGVRRCGLKKGANILRFGLPDGRQQHPRRRTSDNRRRQIRNATTSREAQQARSCTMGSALPHLHGGTSRRHLVAGRRLPSGWVVEIDRAQARIRARSQLHGDNKMKTAIVWAMAAAFAMAAPPWISVQAAQVPAWCKNSGYDNGPPRERGPGTGPNWVGEPTDCQSIWRNGRYRGTDPDPNIRLQLMRYRPASTERRRHRK